MTISPFTAIDVETANADIASICQIGIIHFEDDTVVDAIESLIDRGPECVGDIGDDVESTALEQHVNQPLGHRTGFAHFEDLVENGHANIVWNRRVRQGRAQLLVLGEGLREGLQFGQCRFEFIGILDCLTERAGIALCDDVAAHEVFSFRSDTN